MSNNNIQYNNKNTFKPKISTSKKKPRLSNRILFFVLIFAFVFWTVCSFLSLITFFNNKKDNSIHVAKADSVNTDVTYSYTGSNLTSCAYAVANSSLSNIASGIYNFNFRIDFSVSNNTLTLTNSDFYIYSPRTVTGEISDRAIKGNINTTSFPILETSQARGFLVNYKGGDLFLFNIEIGLNISANFNGNVEYVVIHSTEGNVTGYHNMVDYYDNNNNFLRFSWFIPLNVDNYNIYTNVAKFDYRLYYLPNALENNTDYELGYTEGFNDGKADNQEDIFNDAYSQGLNRGKTIGFENGYQQGLTEAGNYTFTNLLTSVVDAPVSVVYKWLNFDILGFNLSNFFFGLVSLGIVVFVIKLII